MFKRVVIPVLFLCVIALIAFVAYSSVNTSLGETFTLYKEEGIVMYKTSVDGTYTELNKDELNLENGSFVKTGIGYAHVVFSDNSMMSIDQNSEIQISFGDGNTNINQLIGNTWHRVQKVSSGNEYTVETSTAVASVRGTTFGIENLSQDSTDVYVVGSDVEVSQYVLEDNKKMLKNTQKLSSGKYIQVLDFKKHESLKILEIPEKILNSDWYGRNVLIDYEIKDGIPKKLIERIKQIEGLKHLSSDTAVIKITKENIWERAENGDDVLEKQEVFDLLKKLKEKYDIDDATSDICVNVKTGDIDDDIAKVEEYSDYIGFDNAQNIIDYLTLLKKMCEDGRLDETEQKQIRELFYAQSNTDQVQDPIVDPAFDQEVNALLDKYLKLTEGQSENCSYYQNLTTEDILAEFAAVEEQYGVQPVIVDEIRPAIEKTKVACADGVLTIEEINAIDSLLPGD